MNDVQLNDDFDIVTANGDIATGNSDQQSVKLLLLYQKGELRRCPWVGFGIERRIKGIADNNRDLRELKIELENDVFGASTIQGQSIQNFEITI